MELTNPRLEKQRARRAKERAEREAERAIDEAFVADHERYAKLCEARGLEPLPLDAEYSFVCAMHHLGPHVMPYRREGVIWARDLRHKTGENDQIWADANFEAIKTAKE